MIRGLMIPWRLTPGAVPWFATAWSSLPQRGGSNYSSRGNHPEIPESWDHLEGMQGGRWLHKHSSRGRQRH